MKKYFIKIYRIFAKWFQQKYNVVYFEDLPMELVPNTVYLIGEKENPWQAAFICPCGCNATIQLSLLKDSKPRWKVYFEKKGAVSLSPSINRKIGCKSHFFIEKGKIDWAFEYTPRRRTSQRKN